MENPYEVLGVDSDADEATIETVYRERIKDAHPDHGGDIEEFRRVRAAYETIQADDLPATAEDPETPTTTDEDSEDTASTGPGERRGARRRTSPDEEESTEPDSDPDKHRVEYLNYEVFDDHGWQLTDDDLFAKASDADLDPDDYGRLLVQQNETLLEAAENRGFTWPYSCRGGACSNCAVALVEGEMPTPAGHILTEEWLDRGIRLSCLSAPVTESAKVVYNVKQLPGLEELILRPSRFSSAKVD
ncbi:MAG: ferredoxin Fer [Halobacteriales archaeon]|nr:ferredoxin Fer [Halobacteriales archaeon]